MSEPAPIAAEKPVFIRDPNDGQIKQGTAAALPAALAAGAEQVSQEEGHRAQLQERYGDVAGQAASFGIGAGNSLTLGFGKGLAGQLGGDATKEYIKNVTEANPNAEMGGELAGLVAPAILSGGGTLAESLGAKALGTSAKFAGRGLGLGLEGLEGAGELASHALGGKLLGKAAEGAIVGGAYGGGETYSEASLDNIPLTAERMLAGTGKGMLFGAAAGGALGLLGAGVEKVGGAARGMLEDKLGAEGAQGWLEKTAGEKAFKATGAKTADMERLAKSGISPQEAGDWMMENLPKYGDKSFATMTRADIEKAAKASIKDAGKTIGESVKELTEAGAAPDVQKVAARIRSEVLEPLKANPFAEGLVKRVEDMTAKFEERGTATFEDLHNYRKNLDGLIWREGKQMMGAVPDELRNMRKVMESEFREQASAAAPEAAEKYVAANKQFQHASAVDNAVSKSLKREGGNRSFGLTDYLATGLGHMVGGVPGAMVAGAANNVLRSHGDQAMASVLSKVAKMGRIKEIAGAVDEAMSEGAKGTVRANHHGAEKVLAASRLKKDEASDFEAKAQSVQHMTPRRLSEIAAAHGPDPEVAPKAAALYAQKLGNAVTYLNSKRPEGAPLSPLIPTIKQPVPKTEQRKFLSLVKVFEDPASVFQEMKKGTLTPDHVDALKSMYPETYKDLQLKVMSELSLEASKGQKPSFNRSLQIGTLLQMPADNSLTPQFISGMQAGMAPTPINKPRPPAENHIDTKEKRMVSAGSDAIGEH